MIFLNKMEKKLIIKKLNKFLKTKKTKYLFIGSFTFFFIKGLVWLGVFLYAGFNLINPN
tara:strand:- start:536 stop:712 length:177 start_codon:yes stop_codon:yes gene_type:complete